MVHYDAQGSAMAEELLTVKEAASRLKMHPQTLRRWIRRGLLRASKVGSRQWRIKESDLGLDAPRPRAEELERRAAAVERIIAIRKELEGCRVSVDELIRESRRQLERRDGSRRD